MKVTFPKNIQKWLLAGMQLNLWPVSVSVIQLFLLAVWVGWALAIFTALSKSVGTAIAVIAAIPIFVFSIALAFFKISEMWMLEYIAKLFRNKFFDVQKKYQINFERNNSTDVLIKEWKQTEEKSQAIEYKQDDIQQDSKLANEIEDTDLF